MSRSRRARTSVAAAPKPRQPAIITRDAGLSPWWGGEPSVRGAGVAGPRAKPSVWQLRRWSRTNPWIRAAINLRRQQVSRSKWDIIPLDDDVRPNLAVVPELKRLLREPNPKGESFRSLIEPVVEDTLVLDQGCMELEATVGGRLGIGGVPPIAYLWGVDGGRIRFEEEWDGSDLTAPRYWEYDEIGRPRKAFLNGELMCVMANPVTYSPLGLSALEVLAETIEADLAAAEFNRRMVRSATPPGLLDLGEGIRPDQVDAFKAYWDAEIAGKSQVAITGGGKGAKWTPLNSSARDMQWLEWQLYLARKICAVFQCQPQDIGINFDVNRSTAEVGQQFTEDNGVTPLLELFEEYVTREIVWRFDRNLRFAYTDLRRHSNKDAAAYYKEALGGLSWVRPNDALRERGSAPLDEYGDELWVRTPAGPVPMSVYAARLDIMTERLKNPPTPGGPPQDDGPPKPGEGGPAKAADPFDLTAFYRRT